MQSFFLVVHFVGPNQISTRPQEFWAVFTELGVQDTFGCATYSELALFELYLEEYRIPTVFDGAHGELRKLP